MVTPNKNILEHDCDQVTTKENAVSDIPLISADNVASPTTEDLPDEKVDLYGDLSIVDCQPLEGNTIEAECDFSHPSNDVLERAPASNDSGVCTPHPSQDISASIEASSEFDLYDDVIINKARLEVSKHRIVNIICLYIIFILIR